MVIRLRLETFILPHGLREVLEKVVPEDAGNAPKKGHVNILLGENLIYVGTGATQLSCKPGYRTPLFVERPADMPPDVEHASASFRARTPDRLFSWISSEQIYTKKARESYFRPF